MAKFVLGKSFQTNGNGITEKIDSVTRSKIAIVPTRYGGVLAYMTEIDRSSEPRLFTVCPGFYIKDLEPDNGYKALDLEMVPQEKQAGVEEDLRKEGYRGEIKW